MMENKYLEDIMLKELNWILIVIALLILITLGIWLIIKWV